MNAWTLALTVVILAGIIAYGAATGHASEGIGGAALLGGLIASLNSAIPTARQHRESLEHQVRSGERDRIAAVRSESVQGVKRWIQHSVYAST